MLYGGVLSTPPRSPTRRGSPFGGEDLLLRVEVEAASAGNGSGRVGLIGKDVAGLVPAGLRKDVEQVEQGRTARTSSGVGQLDARLTRARQGEQPCGVLLRPPPGHRGDEERQLHDRRPALVLALWPASEGAGPFPAPQEERAEVYTCTAEPPSDVAKSAAPLSIAVQGKGPSGGHESSAARWHCGRA